MIPLVALKNNSLDCFRSVNEIHSSTLGSLPERVACGINRVTHVSSRLKPVLSGVMCGISSHRVRNMWYGTVAILMFSKTP